MAYCSESEVLERAPALKDDELASLRVSDGLKYATALIEGYLKVRFEVPFAAPFPDLVVVIAKDLAASYALRSAFSGAIGSDQLAEATRLEDSARKMLTEIAAGNLFLSDATTKELIALKTPPIYITMTPDLTSVQTMDLLGRFGPKRP